VASFLQEVIMGLQASDFACSHLFQRVASFLQFLWELGESQLALMFSSLSESGFIPTKTSEEIMKLGLQAVLISFREWLHSYPNKEILDRFIVALVLISFREWLHSYTRRLNKGGALSPLIVLISFREWLHSYKR